MTISNELQLQIVRAFVVENWSVNAISKHYKVHHKTIKRYLDLHFEAQNGQPAKQAGDKRHRHSLITEFIPLIQQTYATAGASITASRLYQIVKARGYTGGADHFRHQLVNLGLKPKPTPEAFLRLKVLPGEQAQVDWADFGTIMIDNRKHRLSAFVMVLSYSRRIFLQFMPNMHFDNFLLGHINAFNEWQGVPRVILCDNLKSAVKARQGQLINFNERYLAFATHYSFISHPVGVRRGNEKGRVERAIKYIRDNFFSGRDITTLDALNQEAKQWCDEYAMQRAWPELNSIKVADAFNKEASMLNPLPDYPIEAVECIQASVDKTAHVRYDTNDYSVPGTYVKHKVLIYASQTRVNIYYEQALIASHTRSYGYKLVIQDPQHIEDILQYKGTAQVHTGLLEITAMLPSAEAFIEQAFMNSQNTSKQITGLKTLLARYGAEVVEPHLKQALTNGASHYTAVEHLICQSLADKGVTPPVNDQQATQANQLTGVNEKLKQYDELLK